MNQKIEEFSEEENENSEEEFNFDNFNNKYISKMAIYRFKALKVVPQLSTDGSNLKTFVSIAKEFENLGSNELEKQQFIEFLCETKLTDSNIQKLSVYESAKTLEDLNNNLLKIFKPIKTSLKLHGELSSEKQKSR